MKNTPFLIEKEEFENHSVTDSCDGTDKLPFEFSRSRMWSENFYSPEMGNGHSIAALHRELEQIKLLTGEIKDILKDIFEIDK